MSIEDSTESGAEALPRPDSQRHLGGAAIEQVDQGVEVPLPEGLHTKSGRNPRLAAAESGELGPKVKEGDYFELPTGEEGVPGALEYAQKIFPDQEFSVLSTKGSSATVLERDGLAFKVMSNANDYGYKVKEAAALELLHREGLAPKLHALIDAGEASRTFTHESLNENPFSDVEIPRLNEGGELPIIVMDKVNIGSVKELTDEQRIAAFEQFMDAGQRLDLSFDDVEFVVDTDTGKTIIIDAGGLGRHDGLQLKYKHDETTGERIDRYPGLTDDEFKRAHLARSLLGDLTADSALYDEGQIGMLLKFGTKEDLYRFLNAPKKIGT